MWLNVAAPQQALEELVAQLTASGACDVALQARRQRAAMGIPYKPLWFDQVDPNTLTKTVSIHYAWGSAHSCSHANLQAECCCP
jgi:hypothetical protein